MSNAIIIKHGFNTENAPTYYTYSLYTHSPDTWDDDKKFLYEYNTTTRLYNLTTDTEYDSSKQYFWALSGFVSFYELMYPTNNEGGRLYINDNGEIKQIGRKIFVQTGMPEAGEAVEGDLWVNTSSL